MRDVIPRGFNKIIEEKDTQLTLLNDDPTDAQRNVVVLEQDNVELQAEVERLAPRAVPHLEDHSKDNGMVYLTSPKMAIPPTTSAISASFRCLDGL